MTRRKNNQVRQQEAYDRQERIEKLIARGWIASADEIPSDAIPVDPDRLNTRNSCFPPKYYRAVSFNCRDCKAPQQWEAEDQRWYYETTGAYFESGAVRCRACRKKEQERKTLARRAAGHEKPAGD